MAEVVGEATAGDAEAIAQRLGARAVAEDVAIESDTFEEWVQAEARTSVDWGKVAAVVAAGLAHRNADIALDTATVALENNLAQTLIYGVMMAARVLYPALVATNAVLTTVDVIEGVEEDGIEGGLHVLREDTALAMTTLGMSKPVKVARNIGKPAKVAKKGAEKVLENVKGRVNSGQTHSGSDSLKVVRNRKGQVKGVTNTQSHHIISNKNAALKEHPLWERAQIDPNSSINKMILPTKEGSTMSTTRRSIHQGRHQEKVHKRLLRQMNKANTMGELKDWTQPQYEKALKDIIQKERRSLKSGDRILNKNHRPWAKDHD